MKHELDLSFFAQDTLAVARQLLGMEIEYGDGRGIIVETEAYKGDPASHAVTRPNTGALLRETHGRIYLYRIYGVHLCMNFTSDQAGPGAVLIRALQPVAGIEGMMARRGTGKLKSLASGPGKLVQALAIDPATHGEWIGDSIRLRRSLFLTEEEVATGPRIGISKATDLPWRFWIKGNPHVSGR